MALIQQSTKPATGKRPPTVGAKVSPKFKRRVDLHIRRIGVEKSDWFRAACVEFLNKTPEEQQAAVFRTRQAEA